MAKPNPALLVLQGQTSAPTPAAAATPTEQKVVVPMMAEPAPAKTAKAAAGTESSYTRVMVYVPPKVARKFKEMAFFENRKANDLYLEALDAYLVKQGHGGIKGVTGR